MNNTEIFKYLPNYHDPVVDIEKALRNNSWLGDAATTIAMMDDDTMPVDERILYRPPLRSQAAEWKPFSAILYL